MYSLIPLDQLGPGETAVIRELTAEGGLRRRLQDLGISRGKTICCLHRSLSGDPVAYGICQTVFALRRCDAAHIRVRIGENPPWD